MFRQAKKHKAKKGNFELQKKTNNSLYYWMWKQKRLSQENRLLEERRNMLDGVGFFNEGVSVATNPPPRHLTLIDLTGSKQKKSMVTKLCHESLIDRVRILEETVGRKLSDDKLCNKIKLLEMELFGNVKSGSIKERVESLEKE